MPLIRLPAPSPRKRGEGNERRRLPSENGPAYPFSPLAGRRSRQRDEGQPPRGTGPRRWGEAASSASAAHPHPPLRGGLLIKGEVGVPCAAEGRRCPSSACRHLLPASREKETSGDGFLRKTARHTPSPRLRGEGRGSGMRGSLRERAGPRRADDAAPHPHSCVQRTSPSRLAASPSATTVSSPRATQLPVSPAPLRNFTSG